MNANGGTLGKYSAGYGQIGTGAAVLGVCTESLVKRVSLSGISPRQAVIHYSGLVQFTLFSSLLSIFGAYSMDVVASTSFSVDVDSMSKPNDPFVTNIRKFLKFSFLNPLFMFIGMTLLIL